ncbi:bifunctional 2-polyprenyl-6-hydroxyphenol methylase/3-demethylubiquinol 3-O-methyltransferase UbiG [Novosphingobium colocasiae]|uniref:Ubiquinone biosynthesis O-methyltransferase n=1 Tax=Novosphingobium colocasiae TaxID=1256513 RepID=A0A918PFQ1_9SPHN|nr:bifunctional 2-polyprenyl-6-hydroxyphenol methylase/3-demethylubiquinol 3-O-methyltransferase UbiG [Novosphingobium colocasiae]GGZ03050.1 ubiquinone biosynthesis O-methyltransferase [Novosphingobium colocasiae]
MDNATATSAAAPTIDPNEAAHFGSLASQWWDPNGSSAMLHKLNPVRLSFIREAIDAHFGSDSRSVRPLAGKRALDAGCGAGLLCEPLARLGAAVCGVDAAPENIAAATAHAEAMGLLAPLPYPSPEGEGAAGTVTYLSGELGTLNLGTFDLVTALEVIEHVTDKAAFISQLAARLAPGGLMILSCPNRTLTSRLLMVEAAERLGQVPRGTHDWNQFATPEELAALAADAGLELGEPKGIAWSPLKGLALSDDLSLNFIVTATKG